MLLGIALLISAGLVMFVVAPLLAPEAAGEAGLPVDVTPLADLKRRRLVIYDNLQDLEFEYKAGKLAPGDYQALRRDYTAEAAQLMATSQDLEVATAEDSWIEREVAVRRARRNALPAPDYTCPKCGFENPLPVKFCGECGARIRPAKKQG
ncbi:MAG: zinc ribbon domain-containing protein [Acidobacteriia bacterium]|nr:zinc ribbon domain-containing protein [Terriglobia bacterium]